MKTIFMITNIFLLHNNSINFIIKEEAIIVFIIVLYLTVSKKDEQQTKNLLKNQDMKAILTQVNYGKFHYNSAYKVYYKTVVLLQLEIDYIE